MEKELEQLLRELEEAINESLCDSTSFVASLAKIENAGYDLSLVVEAIIEVRAGTQADNEDEIKRSPTARLGATTTNLTPQDRKFLRLLKIADQ